MDRLKITPTSNRTADVQDIVLRLKKRVRLVFRPMLVDNYKSKDACIRGHFLYQKKLKNDEWEDLKTFPLSGLRSGEWIKLELHSSELLKLIAEINSLYNLYREEGIPRQASEYVKIDSHVKALIKANESELVEFLKENEEDGINVVSKMFRWISGLDNFSRVIQGLETLDYSNLRQLSSLFGISSLERCIKIWEQNKDNSDENFWQQTLSNNSFVLSQMFAYPVIIIKEKAYVGGKSITNTGGSIVDFLAKNNITKDAVIIEIKTPTTKLLGSKYRGVYPISNELSGSISQVCHYRHNMLLEYFRLSYKSPEEFRAFDPLCVVIAGNATEEFEDENKLRSFTLLRGQLSRTQVVTYDELFGKVSLLLKTLKGDFGGI